MPRAPPGFAFVIVLLGWPLFARWSRHTIASVQNQACRVNNLRVGRASPLALVVRGRTTPDQVGGKLYISNS